jgi:glycosyltransferase involved in cell wall biosynthesis
MPDVPRLRVLWLTNLPAPYRFPIWDRMSESVNLTVAFLLKRKNWRNWPAPENKNWKHKFLSLHSLQIKEYDIIPSFRGSKSLLTNVDLAIIGGWESPMYIRTILLAKKKGIPVIQFYESFGDSHRFKSGPISRIRKWILSKPDNFVVISKLSAKALIAMGISEKKIVILYNPVDVSWFNSFAKLHRVPTTPGHKFIYVGQLIERKNIESIIRAFREIRSEMDTLTIAGEGHLLSYLKNLVESLGVSESVQFVGHQNQIELAQLYSRSDTLILASINEVWGLVVNEALAAGLQVVVSDKCGVAEFASGMKGVCICSTLQKSIEHAMKTSSRNWIGYVENPEIMNFTPEKFADAILNLCKCSDLTT